MFARMGLRVAFGLIAGCLAVKSEAQELRTITDPEPVQSPAPTAEEPPVPAGCPGQGALFGSDKGLKIWVTRRGTMKENNPLRPLSNTRLLVFEVAVNGRLATAYGADPLQLSQGGAVVDLERQNGPVSWAASLDVLPQALRVVAADGAVLLGPLPFVTCGQAPRVAARPETARRKPTAKQVPSGPPVALPQGAIP